MRFGGGRSEAAQQGLLGGFRSRVFRPVLLDHPRPVHHVARKELLLRVKIEVAVVRDEATMWPLDYRTWATGDEVREALSWVIDMAERGREPIAGFRLTNEA